MPRRSGACGQIRYDARHDARSVTGIEILVIALAHPKIRQGVVQCGLDTLPPQAMTGALQSAAVQDDDGPAGLRCMHERLDIPTDASDA